MTVFGRNGVKTCFTLCVLLVLTIIVVIMLVEPLLERRGVMEEHNTRDVIKEHQIVTSSGNTTVVTSKSTDVVSPSLLKSYCKEEKNNTQRHVICPFIYGGLGNMLFQYSSAYGISRKVGLDILVNANSDIFQIFDIWAKVSTEETLCPKAKRIQERHCCIYDESLMAVRPNSDYISSMYLQSWKYFEPFEDEIREQLRFRGDIEKKAYDILSGELSREYGRRNYSSRTLVGVHVRRRGLLTEDKIQFGHGVASRSYIKQSLKFFRDKYSDVTFFVCSDDMEWSRANVTGSDVIYIEGNPGEVDLALLSSLNHTIITVGTFGWWGAWLANGTTLYYKEFARNGTVLANEYSPGPLDFIYPGWIGL